MGTKELLINEIERVPEPLLTEVLDFVHFLKAKIVHEKLDTQLRHLEGAKSHPTS